MEWRRLGLSSDILLKFRQSTVLWMLKIDRNQLPVACMLVAHSGLLSGSRLVLQYYHAA